MQRTFIYNNGPIERGMLEDDLISVDRAGFPVDIGRVAVDSVPPFTPADARPQLAVLLRRARRFDPIVALSLACLGCSTRDVLTTIERCRAAELRLFCIDIGKVDLAARRVPAVVRALQSLVRLDTSARQSMSRESISVARALGREPGRPRTLDAAARQRALAWLAEGISVTEVARRLDTSRQTVLRARDAEAHRPVHSLDAR